MWRRERAAYLRDFSPNFQCVDVTGHAIAECVVHHLVLVDQRFVLERRRDDGRSEVIVVLGPPGSCDGRLRIGNRCLDGRFDLCEVHVESIPAEGNKPGPVASCPPRQRVFIPWDRFVVYHMAVRRFFRGTVEWGRLEAVAREIATRYDQAAVRVAFLEADNWLSVPFVVNDEWFVKVISGQNSVVHALLTGARNLGAFSSGTEGFFQHVRSPVGMAERELEATERMREIGVNAPEPIEAFEVDGLGVLVMEYLPSFRTLDDLDPDHVGAAAPDLLASLAAMHDNGLVHGDLRAENVLLQAGEVYFIDATTVREGRIDAARAYDLACALAVLAPIIGTSTTIETAFEHYDRDDVLAAREFLDFVNIRPDHDFDVAAVKGEIEKAAVVNE